MRYQHDITEREYEFIGIGLAVADSGPSPIVIIKDVDSLTVWVEGAEGFFSSDSEYSIVLYEDEVSSGDSGMDDLFPEAGTQRCR